MGVVRCYYLGEKDSHNNPVCNSQGPNPFFWMLDAGNADAGNAATQHPPDMARSFAFGGGSDDVFVTGDWWNTRTTAAGVYRNGLWVLDPALPGQPQADHSNTTTQVTVSFGGAAGDVPVTGTWAPLQTQDSHTLPGHLDPFTVTVPTTLTLQQWGRAIQFPVAIATGTKLKVSGLSLGTAFLPGTLNYAGKVSVRIVASDLALVGNLNLTFSCDPSTPCNGFTKSVPAISITSAAPAGHFTVHTNMEQLATDDYLNPVGTVDGCQPTWSLQQCLNSFFNSDTSNATYAPYYNPNNYISQNVTGVRLLYPAYSTLVPNHIWDVSKAIVTPRNCMPPAGTPGVTPGCGNLTGGPSDNPHLVDTFWDNFDAMLQDLRSYGVRYVATTIGLDNFGPPFDVGPLRATPDIYSTSQCDGSTTPLYFFPWEPYGFLSDGNAECAQPRGYTDAYHPPSSLFWGWQPYYALVDKTLQSIQKAQLQVSDWDGFPELDIYASPVGGRWIQDNTGPSNGMSENVYIKLCQLMHNHGFEGKNGECLVAYETTTALVPAVPAGDTFQDCTGVYEGESPMFNVQSALLHAFAGDYFGPLYGYDSIFRRWGDDYPCATPLTLDWINNHPSHYTGILPSVLASPNELVWNGHTVPPLIDLHGNPSNSALPDPNGSPGGDANVSKVFFNNVKSLVTAQHPTINGSTVNAQTCTINGQPRSCFQMNPTAPYPVILGETFSNQGNVGNCGGEAGNGAAKMIEGFKVSDLYNPFGAGVIFRPFHKLNGLYGGCPTPALLFKNQITGDPVYTPYQNQ